MTSAPNKTSITLDELSLRRWNVLAAHYKMHKATVLWHLINLTDHDSAVAGDWRKYIASHRDDCTGPLRIIRINLSADTTQSLANIRRDCVAGSNQSQVIRRILAFWAQFTTEDIAHVEYSRRDSSQAAAEREVPAASAL